ncbi:Glutamine--tRNA ligase [Candidatus Kinetoplastibacterium sorsogonicusi]|uniref:Glutamine--tRNA ligase n=1 Tax=Candidatus Kinetoplastidibacterium kentomonadis TaxID=1576550 RepID=A0A3Q8ETW7_9PROT|nr:glutamine--tRNA ligase/YqeY domain fusion protein [Candidatus Kinetoplastibacterium sorsogonicusi]AWD32632.1 Glutamine--tRNA ligase [Candidatus Kinetoplastibacterium sorsogonicusi]
MAILEPLTKEKTNFIKNIIEKDLKNNLFKNKLWAGYPAPSYKQNKNKIDKAKIRTRFPPEPNGYLHIGHAKSIFLNFSLALNYNGRCHLRFDDTNPDKENSEYVESIIKAIKWLGYSWDTDGENNLYYASDYFEYMFEFAESMIEGGYAYIDEQTQDEIKLNRGTLTEPGKNSPWRNRPIHESLSLFRDMRDGKFPNGHLVLRAKIDMSSPNINLRDPIIYRIRHIEHYRTKKKWCIYPMYNWAHPIEDALEGITHSICTLEFEDQRPFYDWTLNILYNLNKINKPFPRQYEFSKLNLTYIVTSKRKLLQLIEGNYVEGWDDPRMPTILGLCRRGYTPNSILNFCEKIPISKSESTIDYSILEQSLRDELELTAKRFMAVINPLKLIITNYPENKSEICYAPVNPHNPSDGIRKFNFCRELWINFDDFLENPTKGYFRLYPGNIVRLKYSYIIKCTKCIKDQNNNILEVHAEYIENTKSNTEGSNKFKVKGNITWVTQKYSSHANVILYDRLFNDPYPDSSGKNFLDYINDKSKVEAKIWLEEGIVLDHNDYWQFERMGYFKLDKKQTNHIPIINRIVTLKDSWKNSK